jgi:hypothetical protein
MSRFVSSVIGDRLKSSVLESAKLYAMFGHAIANTGFVEYTTKYKVYITFCGIHISNV